MYGVGNAASYGAVLGILAELFPDKVSTIMSSCESFFGVGYTIGTEYNICEKNKKVR